MAHKQVLFRSAAREKILRGAAPARRCRSRDARAAVKSRPDREKVGRADRVQ